MMGLFLIVSVVAGTYFWRAAERGGARVAVSAGPRQEGAVQVPRGRCARGEASHSGRLCVEKGLP